MEIFVVTLEILASKQIEEKSGRSVFLPCSLSSRYCLWIYKNTHKA